jgi:hypothetical protein
MHRELIEETDVRGKRPELGGLCKFACDNKSSMWTVIWTTSDNKEDVVTADGSLPHDLLISYLATCRNVAKRVYSSWVYFSSERFSNIWFSLRLSTKESKKRDNSKIFSSKHIRGFSFVFS